MSQAEWMERSDKDAMLHKLQDENDNLKKQLDELENRLYLWEDIEDEDLFEDGEIDSSQVCQKIFHHVMVQGDWVLKRRVLDNE